MCLIVKDKTFSRQEDPFLMKKGDISVDYSVFILADKHVVFFFDVVLEDYFVVGFFTTSVDSKVEQYHSPVWISRAIF